MKKYLLFLFAALLMAGCTQKNVKNSRTEGLTPADKQAEQGLTAYVEYDSLMTQYEYCKEYSDQLQQRFKSYQQQLASKQSALENAASAFQRKLQSGQFASQEAAEAEQKKLMGQQEQLQKLSADLEEKFAKEQEDINKALHDSVQNFLKDFNKDGRYKLILAKSGDNILYAEKELDITEDIVKGLNKRYKKSSAKK